MVRPPKRFEPAHPADRDRPERRDPSEFVKGRRAASPFLDEREPDEWVPGVGPHYDQSVFESKYAVRSIGHHVGPDGPVAQPPGDDDAQDDAYVAEEPVDHAVWHATIEPEEVDAEESGGEDLEVDLRDGDRPALTFYQRRSAKLPRLEDARRAAEDDETATPPDPFAPGQRVDAAD